TSPFVADWNPGSLGFLPQAAVALQHSQLFGGAVHDSLGVAYPTLDQGAFSLTISRLEVGGVERRSANNLPAGNLGLLEQLASAGYGYNFWGPFTAGAAVTAHYLRLDGLQAIAPGLDAGAAFRMKFTYPFFQEVSAGVSCRNALLTPMLRLQSEGDPQYPAYRLGAAVKMKVAQQIPDQLLIRIEAEKPERADLRWHGGAEYALYNLVAVRGGWDHEYFSAGLGITYAGLTLDYAVSFPELGLRHLLTLSYAMGESIDVLRAKREENEERRRQEIIAKMKTKIIQDYRAQAKTLTQERKYDEAAKLWEKVLDWEPENAQAMEQLALVTKEIIRRENARDLATANEDMRKQNYIDVMVSCQQVLERDPENAIAQSLYAEAEKKAQSLGKFSYTTNMQMLEKIRSEYAAGLKAYTQRNYQDAVRHWEMVIETTPLQKQVYRYLQNARERILKAQQAQAGASAQKAAPPSKSQQLYKEAVDLSRGGKLKEAVRSWEKLVKENPEDKDAKQNLDKTRQNLIDSQKKGIRW
ncbi:hypothetical protein JW933_08825, partial [candidate division FCPU426 bacterium]|nr:hypothetical protein [candidate division FCPU426 bacterium]